MEPLTGHTISSQRVHEGQRISLRIDNYRLGEKTTVTKEIVEHPGGVTIIPITDHGTALLIRQWRQTVGDMLLEAPAGTLEPGEDPVDCAHRELREEAGVRAGKMTPVGGSWVSPGYSTEFNWGFLATNLTEDPLPQDDGEDIHTVEVDINDIPRMIREGELQDQMTIAVYLAAMHVFETQAAKAPLGN